MIEMSAFGTWPGGIISRLASGLRPLDGVTHIRSPQCTEQINGDRPGFGATQSQISLTFAMAVDTILPKEGVMAEDKITVFYDYT